MDYFGDAVFDLGVLLRCLTKTVSFTRPLRSVPIVVMIFSSHNQLEDNGVLLLVNQLFH